MIDVYQWSHLAQHHHHQGRGGGVEPGQGATTPPRNRPSTHDLPTVAGSVAWRMLATAIQNPFGAKGVRMVQIMAVVLKMFKSGQSPKVV